ncbi:MAG: glycosyltransferase family 1 protein [Actinomycetota bacterium]
MDVTSLLGTATGVGAMTRAIAERLPGLLVAGEVELTGYVVSVRGRSELRSVLPDGWSPRALPYPARLAHRLWRSVDVPAVTGFDLVHGPNYVVPPTGGAARLVTVHDLTAWRFPELVSDHCRAYPEHLVRAVAGGAHVHAVSHHVAGELTADVGLPVDRVHVVANGYTPVPGDRPADGARGLAAVGSPYVLAIGTVEPRKDHVGLVMAMTEVWTRFPDIVLAIVGEDGWAANELNETIAGLGCGDRIVRLGYVTQELKQDLLAGAELLAFPSRYEGFGLPVLEAMDVGVPVVSTTAGSIPEVAGDAALLVEPGDPAVMADALISVLEDRALRARLVSAGRSNVSRYSWDRTAAAMVSLYDRLLTDHPYRAGQASAGSPRHPVTSPESPQSSA